MVIFESAHFFELLLDPSAALERALEYLGELLPIHLTIGEDDFRQSGHGLSHRLAVARVQMGPERKMPVDDLGKVMLSQFP